MKYDKIKEFYSWTEIDYQKISELIFNKYDSDIFGRYRKIFDLLNWLYFNIS